MTMRARIKLVIHGCWSLLLVGWVLTTPGCGKELGDLGTPCLFSSDCKAEYRCINEKCATGAKENTPCALNTDCDQGLQCIEKKCQFDGKACEEDTQCDSGLRCSGRKCLKPADSGAPCLDTKGCKAPLVCAATGTCVDTGKPGTKGVDDACEKSEECQRGLACDPKKKKCQTGGDVGSPCKSNVECNKTLACAFDGTCAKKGDPGTAGAGENCNVPQDCQLSFTCGTGGKCASDGLLPKGSTCVGNENCIKGLLCATVKNSPTGTCEEPGQPGTKLPGTACENPLDCSFGSICGFDNQCVLVRPFIAQTCPVSAQDTKGEFRVLFEVPGEKVEEFFRLPYPNDIRLNSNGFVDLRGFPNPGPLLGEDLVGKYIQALEKELKGFSTNPTITFRTSSPINFDSIELNNATPSILYVNLDTGNNLGFNVSYNSGRTPYICGPHLTIRAPRSPALQEGKTYVVLLTDSIKNADGKKIQRDKDFDAILGSNAPSDSRLSAAYERYKKLREWLKKNETDGKFPATQHVVAAAMFTTHKPSQAFAKFRDVVQQQAKPQLKDITVCKDGVKSPCDSENAVASRACGKSDGEFHEIHAKITLPIFQQGQSPYVKEGGDIRWKSDDTPEVATTQDICVALTIPKGDAPTEGWPVLIYAHGTGGNFRSHIADGTAQRVSNIARDGKTIKYVTLGMDQVVHGLRRGSDKTHPNFLFFNFRNPGASLGNTLQNAADQYSLVRWLKDGVIPAQNAPESKEIKFNKDQLVFLGHSQGGFVGPLFLAYDTDVKAAVLSGAGGGLIYSLLGKTNPINIAAGVRAILGEGPTSRVDDNHPVLNLFQHYFDRADAVNYGHLLFQSPPKDIPAKHILQTYGVGDTYTPKDSITTLALVMGVTHAGPAHEDLGSFSKNTTPFPIQGNKTFDGKKITGVFTQYRPDADKDGHFVLFNNSDAIQHLKTFLATYLLDKDRVPTVGP